MAGRDASHAVATASGTAALVASLRARAKGPGLCLMPAWTFAATPAAALMAGLTPYFLDVDAESWALAPERVIERARALSAAAILPVVPFGSGLDGAAWSNVERQSGAPVVVDAAAAFDLVTSTPDGLGDIPVILSLHATKALGCGEGGLVLTRDEALAAEIRRLTNFGFGADRLAIDAGFNGKMSEYNAAVGLAALDAWPERQAEWLGAKRRLRAAVQSLDGVQLGPDAARDLAVSTFNITTDHMADALKLRLGAQGVMTLRWWSVGCANHPAFQACPRDALPVTDALAEQVLGLPLFPDISDAQVHKVASALEVSVTQAGRQGSDGTFRESLPA